MNRKRFLKPEVVRQTQEFEGLFDSPKVVDQKEIDTVVSWVLQPEADEEETKVSEQEKENEEEGKLLYVETPDWALRDSMSRTISAITVADQSQTDLIEMWRFAMSGGHLRGGYLPTPGYDWLFQSLMMLPGYGILPVTIPELTRMYAAAPDVMSSIMCPPPSPSGRITEFILPHLVSEKPEDGLYTKDVLVFTDGRFGLRRTKSYASVGCLFKEAVDIKVLCWDWRKL